MHPSIRPLIYTIGMIMASPWIQAGEILDLHSPNEAIVIRAELKGGHLSYTISHRGQVVIEHSPMGLVTDHGDFSSGLTGAQAGPEVLIEESYELLNGKKRHIRYAARRQTLSVRNTEGDEIGVEFHVSNDGVAFRYHLTGFSKETWCIQSESTGYRFPEHTLAWIQPIAQAQTGWAQTQPSYEEHYLNRIPLEELDVFLAAHRQQAMQSSDWVDIYPYAGWVFPALFNISGSDTWVLLSECAVGPHYCGSRLIQKRPGRQFLIGFPMREERISTGAVNPHSRLPWTTPWRLVVIGDQLGTIVESTMGTDLAEPSKIEDSSFVKPGKASWSWLVMKDDSIHFETQKAYVDYAARMGWEYTLIDVNWDRNIGYERIRELAAYAENKGVGLILWYNSSGSWNTTEYSPKDQLLTPEARDAEFKRISEMGIKGIKVDFFPGDGQSVMALYHDLFQSAAKYRLMINTHGTTLPRGWQRTYPNLVTMESVRGMEYVTFTQADADQEAVHAATLPFTRNVFDPMDFTPMILTKLKSVAQRTRMDFELALTVLFQSGIQHLGETPEGMANQPDFVTDFLRDLPTVWDETRFIDGYPSVFVVLARRKGNRWYIAGINASNTTREVNISLPGINLGKGQTLIMGHADEDNLIEISAPPDSDSTKRIQLQPHGGFVSYTVEP